MTSTTPDTVTGMSVRELIAELSMAEDGLRQARHGGSDRSGSTAGSEVASLVHREQMVVRELRRRARTRRIEESRGRAFQR